MSIRCSFVRSGIRTLIVLLATFVVQGCYRMRPIEGPTPELGRVVRLDLTDAGSVRLAPYIGPRVEAIEGRTERMTDSSYVLLVTSTVARGGLSTPWSNERLDVPVSAVARVRSRALDARRSWIAAGIGLAGVVLLSQVFDLGTGLDGFFGGKGGSGRK